MGNILSFILNQPLKYKRNLFLDYDSITISIMVYQGENMLVIESKIQGGCRILLNRNDLLSLQDLEWSIFETFKRKTKIVKPLVEQQINQIALYLKTNTKVETRTLKDMTNHVESIYNVFIATHVNDYNFTSQLQLYTAEHIAQKWLDELEKDEGYSDEKPFSPPSFYTIFNEEILPDISSMSPPSQTSCTDENDGPYGPQYNTYTDENDGPEYNKITQPKRRHTI